MSKTTCPDMSRQGREPTGGISDMCSRVYTLTVGTSEDIPLGQMITVNVSTFISMCNELAKLRERVAELEAALAEARKWVPPITVGSGSISYPPTVVADWDTPEEDAAWKHLEDDEELPK